MARFWYQNHNVGLGQGPNFTTMLYWFKETAKSAGWTVLQASNGTTFWKVGDPGSEPITSAAWMNANNSWFLIQMPDGNRKFIFLHASQPYDWYIGYAKTGTYLDGGIATPALPNTAEEMTIHGNQTTRAVKTINSGGTNQYYQIMVNGSAPYDYYAFLTNNGSGVSQCVIFGEEVLSPSAGDTDPFVCNASNSNLILTGQNLAYTPDTPQLHYGNTQGCYGWLGNNMSGFVYTAWQEYTGPTFSFPNYLGTGGPGVNPWDGSDDVVRTVIARMNDKNGPGYKGISNLFRLTGTNRAAGSMFSVDAVEDWFAIGHVLLPWNNSVGAPSL